MKTLLISAALAAAIIPTVATAQAIPGAVIAVVDLERVTRDCTACKSATATLRSQANALQNRQKALATPLETEGKSIQSAIDALQGKAPDAALQARAKSWETRRQAAGQEVARSQEQIQRNQQYISQQITAKLGPIYQQVLQRRGANIMLEMGGTLAAAGSTDVSSDVLTALNSALPSVQTTAPAGAATQQPQGR
jgi:outer membrane protein